MNRVLILSWEYPPLIEGGLARHVRKLSESLAELGTEVHVLTRGGEESPAEEVVAGVHIHRVREPRRPRDLGEFVAWVERMNSDMLAAGVELGDRFEFDLVHGHDWLVATACDHLARRFAAPLVTTIHATEHGRHQGWVDKHPQSYIHGVERWITNRSDRVIACSYYMREQIADIFGVEDERVERDPQRNRPRGPAAPGRRRAASACAPSSRRPDEKLVLLIGRLVYEKGFQIALEAMPELIERVPGTRFLVAGLGHARGRASAPGRGRSGCWSTGPSSAGSATTSCTRSTRSPTSASCPRSTSPSASSRSRRWPRAAPASSPTPAACARSCPTTRSGCASAARDPESLAEVAERVLADDELGRRLVAEAHEHVRRFDWLDVAERTAAVYSELSPQASRA